MSLEGRGLVWPGQTLRLSEKFLAVVVFRMSILLRPEPLPEIVFSEQFLIIWYAFLLQWYLLEYLGDCNYSFQVYFESISIVVIVSCSSNFNTVTGNNSPHGFAGVFCHYSNMI